MSWNTKPKPIKGMVLYPASTPDERKGQRTMDAWLTAARQKTTALPCNLCGLNVDITPEAERFVVRQSGGDWGVEHVVCLEAEATGQIFTAEEGTT